MSPATMRGYSIFEARGKAEPFPVTGASKLNVQPTPLPPPYAPTLDAPFISNSHQSTRVLGHAANGLPFKGTPSMAARPGKQQR